MPARLVFGDVFNWSGLFGDATVEVTVTADAEGYEGLYLWNYQITNDSFNTSGDGAVVFQVTVGCPEAVDDLGTDASGWAGAVADSPYVPFGGTGDNQVWWAGEEDPLGTEQSTEFWFTTPPAQVISSSGVLRGVMSGFGSTLIGSVAAPGDLLPVVAVFASDTFEGAATGGFSFTRTGGNINAPLTITYTVGGTATPGTDYTALTGTVEFAAGVDRVEVPVAAFGDNLPDDGETVTAALDDGGDDYLIDEEAEDATVTIADQPNTVSVIWLADGAETGGSGAFRFIRSGNLSDELTVYYTVTGTAESGIDFTALAGSVTFDENEDTVDLPVYVTDDYTGEPTETVIVTLVEDEAFIFGSDSATLFIRDNDTRRLVWTGEASDGLFGNASNWVIMGTWTTAAPERYDDLYFLDAGKGDCIDFGSTLTGPLYGLHIGNTYDGVVILSQALTVGTFEQTTATVDLPHADYDLTITDVMLWSGGTLGGVANADVTIDGAAGRLDPPNEGAMYLGSTLNVIDAVVDVFGGTIDFIGGDGLYVAGQMNLVIDPEVNVEFAHSVPTGAPTLEIATGRHFRALVIDHLRTGRVNSAIPILNNGSFYIAAGIHFKVTGRLGGDGPSLQMDSGDTVIRGGTNVELKYGMLVAGGTLQIEPVRPNKEVGIKVNEQGTFKVTGGTITFISFGRTPFFGPLATRGVLLITGAVDWTGGTYEASVDLSDGTRASRWEATETFTIGANAKIDRNPVGTGSATTWQILLGKKGINGTHEGHIAEGLANHDILVGGMAPEKRWYLHKTG